MDEMMNPQPQEQPRKATHKVVYTIVERKGFKHWLRVGVAFENRDRSLRVILDASPSNNELHIRDPKPEDDRRAPGRANNAGAFNGNGTGSFPGMEELS